MDKDLITAPHARDYRKSPFIGTWELTSDWDRGEEKGNKAKYRGQCLALRAIPRQGIGLISLLPLLHAGRLIR
jgi:hypothetical protein